MKYGITLVSHVEEIAYGLPQLLKQVAQEVPITFAGGTSDGDVGTSMEKILAAFENNEADEILAFYARLKQVLGEREYKILYLDMEKIAEGIEIIRRERVDQEGNEMWFPLMMEYLRSSPCGLRHGWQGFDDLVAHLEHRKSVELRLLSEIFPEHAVILKSKDYDLTEI